MNRRGHLLLECLIAIMILGMILEIGLHGFELLDSGPAGDGRSQRVDAICDRLRRDLRGGFRWDGAVLIAGEARWHVESGRLLRNGVDQAAATVMVDDGHLVIQCGGLAPRRLDLDP